MTSADELRRLRWRCRRGLLELDLVLQAFVGRSYAKLTPQEQAAFRRLLSVPDPTLLEYLNRIKRPQDKELVEVVNKIRQYIDF